MAGRCLLLVEDEDLVRMLLATYLGDLGFEVTLAGTAAEAKDKMRLLGSTVVGAVIDMSLPDGQGDALLRELRILQPNFAAIISSGYDPARFQSSLAGERSVEYLKKPFSRQQLQDALHNLGVNP
jgi:DNA-binding NtrC family response regulator